MAKAITCRLSITPALAFLGDEGDLLELLGNLADHAFKWCRSRVAVSICQHPSGELDLMVEDDGPGTPGGLATGCSAVANERMLPRQAMVYAPPSSAPSFIPSAAHLKFETACGAVRHSASVASVARNTLAVSLGVTKVAAARGFPAGVRGLNEGRWGTKLSVTGSAFPCRAARG